MLTWFTYTLWNIHHNWESQLLGRLRRSPGSLRRRKGSGALKKKKGVWGSQGEKDKLFFPTSLCGSQYNNVACSRTCFSFLRTFWLILSSSNVCCGSGSSKIYKALVRLPSGALSIPRTRPPSDVYVRRFLCPFNKTLLPKSSWVIKPGPWPKAKSTLEITNLTPFTISYHNQANQHVHYFTLFPFFCLFFSFLCWELLLFKQIKGTQQYYHIAVHQIYGTYLFILHNWS